MRFLKDKFTNLGAVNITELTPVNDIKHAHYQWNLKRKIYFVLQIYLSSLIIGYCADRFIPFYGIIRGLNSCFSLSHFSPPCIILQLLPTFQNIMLTLTVLSSCEDIKLSIFFKSPNFHTSHLFFFFTLQYRQ